MAKLTLHAQPRTITGRKVKKLRKEGFLPANVYGKKIKSQSLSLLKEEFLKIYQQAGETEIIDLKIEGEKDTRPVLIQNLQVHPLSNDPLHVDLRQIILTEKLTAKIPVELIGESPAVAQKIGILIQPINEIEIEALPTDLPEKFVVDISKLANVDDEIKVKNLEVNQEKIEIKTDPELTIIKINPLAEEEITPPPAPEEGEEAPAEVTEEASPPSSQETPSEDNSN